MYILSAILSKERKRNFQYQELKKKHQDRCISIESIIGEWYKQLYGNKFENLSEREEIS